MTRADPQARRACDGVVDISELYRMAERMDELAERADDDGHSSLRERFDEVADDLRAIARDLTAAPDPA